jgi:hypothetical protein
VAYACNECDLRAGILACLDGYMNIAMEQTEEYVNGQLKNKYGDCFIRGNNGESGLPGVSWPASSAAPGLACPQEHQQQKPSMCMRCLVLRLQCY